MEQAVEYFAVFGGLGTKVDTSVPLVEAVEHHLWKHYAALHAHVVRSTGGDAAVHALLSGIATGDGRMHSAFKRARLSEADGTALLESLCKSGIIERQSAPVQSRSWIEENRVDDRLRFTSPFLRFWFAFVSPIFKGIRDGDFAEAKTRFENRWQEFVELPFRELSMELLKSGFDEDPVVEIGSYWDANVEIDILAKTASGTVIAAACKHGGAKLKKSELTRLREKCAQARIDPDICVLVARGGFSNELKSLKGGTLRLLGIRNFKSLLQT